MVYNDCGEQTGPLSLRQNKILKTSDGNYLAGHCSTLNDSYFNTFADVNNKLFTTIVANERTVFPMY